jgi:hypothetical protein
VFQFFIIIFQFSIIYLFSHTPTAFFFSLLALNVTEDPPPTDLEKAWMGPLQIPRDRALADPFNVVGMKQPHSAINFFHK